MFVRANLSVLSLLFIFLVFNSSLFAQKQSVHLKNGSVIRGKVLEFHPDSIIKVQSNGNIWVFQTEELLYEKDYVPAKDSSGVRFEIRPHTVGLGLQISYRFKNRMQSGIGLSLSYIDDELFLPVFADFRYDLFDKSNTLFVLGSAGYSFYLSRYYNDYGWYEDYDIKGGLHLKAGIGYKFWFPDNWGFSIYLAYRYQAYSESYSVYQQTNPPILQHYDYQYSIYRPELGVAFSF